MFASATSEEVIVWRFMCGGWTGLFGRRARLKNDGTSRFDTFTETFSTFHIVFVKIISEFASHIICVASNVIDSDVFCKLYPQIVAAKVFGCAYIFKVGKLFVVECVSVCHNVVRKCFFRLSCSDREDKCCFVTHNCAVFRLSQEWKTASSRRDWGTYSQMRRIGGKLGITMMFIQDRIWWKIKGEWSCRGSNKRGNISNKMEK